MATRRNPTRARQAETIAALIVIGALLAIVLAQDADAIEPVLLILLLASVARGGARR